jgi:hypothetical protein
MVRPQPTATAAFWSIVVAMSVPGGGHSLCRASGGDTGASLVAQPETNYLQSNNLLLSVETGDLDQLRPFTDQQSISSS